MKRALALAALATMGALALSGPGTAAGERTRISAGDSEFGPMIWAPKRQAIYMFDRDERGKSSCYGRCAKAWPSVIPDGEPRAGRGVDPELLGTTRRRNGDRQVTYAGKPLYTYAHEGRGEVLCHDVRLNGGLLVGAVAAGQPAALTAPNGAGNPPTNSPRGAGRRR